MRNVVFEIDRIDLMHMKMRMKRRGEEAMEGDDDDSDGKSWMRRWCWLGTKYSGHIGFAEVSSNSK